MHTFRFNKFIVPKNVWSVFYSIGDEKFHENGNQQVTVTVPFWEYQLIVSIRDSMGIKSGISRLEVAAFNATIQ